MNDVLEQNIEDIIRSYGVGPITSQIMAKEIVNNAVRPSKEEGDQELIESAIEVFERFG